MPRTLDVIPILHTEADLGGLADAVRDRIGDASRDEKDRAIAELWRRIADHAERADAAGLHLFQDGLPADDRSPEAPLAITRELAEQGSVNHQILMGLVRRGAILHGTEAPTLLLREYDLAAAAAEAAAAGRSPDPRDRQRAESLLERRDQFIAQRIAEHLPEGGRGLLLIGMLHRVEPKLPSDVFIRHPLAPQSEHQQPREERTCA